METRKIALLGAVVAASLAGQAAHAIRDIDGVKFNRAKRRHWARLDAPHDYPPNPFESRQVRRARERQEQKQRKNSK